MWLYAIYCVGAFNMCQGAYATESNPRWGYQVKTEAECRSNAILESQIEMMRRPGFDIRWKCVNVSNMKPKEDGQ